MTTIFAREVGLLRTLARNLVSMPPLAGRDALRPQEFALQGSGKRIAIRPPGREAFAQLSEAIISRVPAMARGAVFATVQTELFDVLENQYLGRDPAMIGAADVSALHNHFVEWFDTSAKPRKVFFPCFISRWAAPSFTIGPVDFIFIEEFAQSEFYPRGDDERARFVRGFFDQMLRLARDSKAYWIVCARIEGCERDRAQEVGALAVDLAIVALQLTPPAFDSGTMARLDARRGTVDRFTLSEANGGYVYGSFTTEPGLLIGPGKLEDILQKTAPIIAAVGSCVRSFATGRFHYPTLERSWCDAAYWLHQALAEPLDPIAVAMLETALEVLFCAENSPGSEKRILQILDVFFGLKPDDVIAPGETTTARRFAKDVVSDRSRILHGTWSTLNSRLALNRASLETFVVSVLRQAALELHGYSLAGQEEGGIGSFLAWVKSRRAGSETSPNG